MTEAGKKVILVDMDGVLANFELGFLTAWRDRFPHEPFIPLADRNTFYLHEQYGEERQRMVRSITREPGFFHSLPPIDGSIEGIMALRDRGPTVHICTAPLAGTPTCLQEKYDWVLDLLGKDFAKSMIIARDKTLIRGDFLIDDRIKLQGFYEDCPSWEHIIFEAPYNSGAPGHRYRIKSWAHAPEIFDMVL